MTSSIILECEMADSVNHLRLCPNLYLLVYEPSEDSCPSLSATINLMMKLVYKFWLKRFTYITDSLFSSQQIGKLSSLLSFYLNFVSLSL